MIYLNMIKILTILIKEIIAVKSQYTIPLNKNSKIFIAGHRGMVGSSILKIFKQKGYKNVYVQKKISWFTWSKKHNLT